MSSGLRPRSVDLSDVNFFLDLFIIAVGRWKTNKRILKKKKKKNKTILN